MTRTMIICPICGMILHEHRGGTEEMRASVPSRTPLKTQSEILGEMVRRMEREHDERIRSAEEACRRHYEKRHRIRYWLWLRTRRNAFMNKRWIIWGRTPEIEFKVSSG